MPTGNQRRWPTHNYKHSFFFLKYIFKKKEQLATSLSFSSLLSDESDELPLLELLPLSEDMIPMTALSCVVGIFPANFPPPAAVAAVAGTCRVAGSWLEG